MRSRTTLFLALLAALLGAVILFWDRDTDNTRDRLDRARRAFRFNPDRVDALLIDNGDAPPMECRRNPDGSWRLTRPIAARADSTAIGQLLAALQELPRGEIILPSRGSTSPYTPYGLSPPRATITILEGSVSNRILIGRRTPLGDGVYVRQADHAGLARISTALLDLLPPNAAALRSRALLTADASSIRRLDIRNASGYIQLARTLSGEWRMFQPVAARVDPILVAGLLDSLLSCSIVQFVQDNVGDLAPYGLDSRSTVTAVLDTGSGEGSRMIAFGDPLPNAPDLVYARLQAENSVYAVPADPLQALLPLRADDLRDRRIPGLDPASLRRITVRENETTLDLQRDTNDLWHIHSPLRIPADPTAMDALFDTWSSSRVTAFETLPAPSANQLLPVPATAAADLPFRPHRTLILYPLDPSAPPVTLHLAPSTNHTLRLRVDDDTSTALVTPDTLLTFPLDPSHYQTLQILTIPPDELIRIQHTTPARTWHLERDPATGQWLQPPATLPDLLTAFSPLTALRWLPLSAAPKKDIPPLLTLRLTQRGTRTLSTTLRVYPGGIALLRGTPRPFQLPPATLDLLLRLPE